MPRLKTNSTFNGVVGATYAKQMLIFLPNYLTGMAEGYGNCDYGGEFKLFDTDNSDRLFATANTENNKMGWQAEGLLVWAFTAEETLLWQGIRHARYQLFLRLPTYVVDPKGTKILIDTGLIRLD